MIRSLALVCLLLPALAVAQNQKPPADKPAAEKPAPAQVHLRHDIVTDEHGLTLPEGEVTIEELIDASAKYLGRNILWNAQEMASAGPPISFFFQKRLAVDARGCEELLYSLLSTKYFAVIPIDDSKGLFEVVSMNGPRAREIMTHAVARTPDEVLRRPNFREVVLVCLPLQNINANVAANSLRPFFSTNGSPAGGSLALASIGNNQALLLTGFADQVVAAMKVIKECDRAPVATPQDPPLQRLEQLEASMKAMHEKLDALTKTDKK